MYEIEKRTQPNVKSTKRMHITHTMITTTTLINPNPDDKRRNSTGCLKKIHEKEKGTQPTQW